MGLDLRPTGWQSRMFWGLRSLWRIPLILRTSMAWAICCRNMRMVSSLNVPLAARQNDCNKISWGIRAIYSRHLLLTCLNHAKCCNKEFKNSYHSQAIVFVSFFCYMISLTGTKMWFSCVSLERPHQKDNIRFAWKATRFKYGGLYSLGSGSRSSSFTFGYLWCLT